MKDQAATKNAVGSVEAGRASLVSSLGQSLFRMVAAAFAWQSRAVLARHARVYMRTWKTGVLPPVVEPLIFFVAFGLGLGGHIDAITWRGQSMPYTSYVAPALVAYTGFTTAFYEGLYASYVRMFYQKTWDGMLATQIRLEHVLWGEILWASCRATVNASIVALVLAVLHAAGLITIHPWALLWAPGIVLMSAWSFAAFALVFTSVVPGIEHINYPVFLVGIPLGLLSQTYFPIPEGHAVLDVLVQCNPVAHLAELIRALLLGASVGARGLGLFVSASLLLLVSITFVERRVRRKLTG